MAKDPTTFTDDQLAQSIADCALRIDAALARSQDPTFSAEARAIQAAHAERMHGWLTTLRLEAMRREGERVV